MVARTQLHKHFFHVYAVLADVSKYVSSFSRNACPS